MYHIVLLDQLSVLGPPLVHKAPRRELVFSATESSPPSQPQLENLVKDRRHHAGLEVSSRSGKG